MSTTIPDEIHTVHLSIPPATGLVSPPAPRRLAPPRQFKDRIADAVARRFAVALKGFLPPAENACEMCEHESVFCVGHR